MTTLTLVLVGFALVTGLVIALARTSTARWEEAKRSARAPLPAAGAGPPASATGPAALPGRIERNVVAAIRGAASSAASLWGTASRLLRRTLRSIGTLLSALRGGALRKARSPDRGSGAPPRAEDAAAAAEPTVPVRSRGRRPVSRGQVAGRARRRLFHRPRSVAPRRVGGLLHRHHSTDQ